MNEDSKHTSLFFTQEELDTIKEMNLWNDELFTLTFDNQPEAAQELIQRTLDDPTIHIVRARAQVTEIPVLRKHGIRIDGLAFDACEKVYVIEVQQEESGMPPERRRYIQSAVDTVLLNKGEEYRKIPKTVFIVLHKHNPFGTDIGWDEEVTFLKRAGLQIDNGQYRIHLNGEWQGNDPRGEIAHDFSEVNPENMFCKALGKRVSYLKNEEGGIQEMSTFMQKYIELGEQRGEKRGEKRGEQRGIAMATNEFVRTLLQDSEWSIARIARVAKTNEEHVREIQRSLQEKKLELDHPEV